MRALLYQWIKTNIVMLVNAGSLISTTAVTSMLGFVYWWVAARWFPPEAVGLGSAAISAMALLGTISTLGLGTLLTGELARQPGKEGPLISASLIVAGGAGGCAGIVFALVAPFVATDFQALRASVINISLFAVGVSLTTIALVLDYALIGLLRGGLQLWRNTLFAVAKLAVLFVVSLWLSQKVGLTIYTTWLVGNALSLTLLTVFVVLKRERSLRSYLPQWGLLGKLGSVALQHHIFNLLILLSGWFLPVLVTILLSARVNAWFYVSFMLANFIFNAANALTIVLYAMSSAHPAILAHKARLTLGLGAVTVILANCIFQFATGQVLGVFGHIYAEQATWSLRILALGTLPYLIRSHYVAICRSQGRILYALLPMAAGTLLELGAATLGGRLGGLSGLSLGWVAALYVEAMFMSYTVFKAVRPIDVSTNIDQLQQHPLQPESRRILHLRQRNWGLDSRSDELIPTPVQLLIDAYLQALEPLHDHFYGIYIYGSIVLGGFDERESDIDILALTHGDLGPPELAQLKALHTQLLWAHKLGKRLEVLYIPLYNLGKSDREIAAYPTFQFGKFSPARYAQLSSVTWWTVKTKGIRLLGPERSSLPFEVTWQDVLETMRDNLNDGFWATPTERPYLFLLDGWIVLTVATLCRMLTTIEEGEIVTYLVALKRWRDRLPTRWCPLIDEAWRIRSHLPIPSLYHSRLKRMREVLAFIEYVRERGGKVFQATAQR